MKKKVLFIQPALQYYRISVFNELAKEFDVTVLHSGKPQKYPELNFNQLNVKIHKIGPFFILQKNLFSFCKQFDVVVSEGNIRHFDRWFLVLNPFRSYKWIHWSIGVSASYHRRFDEDNRFEFIRHFLFKNGDASVFYSAYPIDKYLNAGFDKRSLFVAHNTTSVSYNENIKYDKSSLLFVGTLYKQKKIYELLEAYEKASKILQKLLPLIIIGNGVEYESISKWISEKNLDGYIKLVGAVYDVKELEPYFRQSFACISPGQAGLTVLTSMGFGTPFITKKVAITGGEIFNIKNNENGIIYDQEKDLTDIIIDIHKNSQKYISMGINARKYYLSNRRPDQMVEGLVAAINYSLRL